MDESLFTSEQLRYANGMLKAKLRLMEYQFSHRLALQEERLKQLEAQQADHESRLRSATEGVIQFKIISGLASGSSSLLSLAALLKAFLGG